MRKISLILLLSVLCVGMNAQVQTHIYNERVRTLRVLRACDVDDAGQIRTMRPFLILKDGVVDGSEEDNTLHVSFDEMSHDVHFYTYTVRHMNADWAGESNILTSEYLQGFTTMDITDYVHSINTSREYTHYEFLFPNPDMQLTLSGNYLLSIYEDGNPDKRVAEVQFCVVEPVTGVEGKVRSNTDIEFNGRYQQLDLDINTTALSINDPNEIRVLVRQNNREDNSVWLTRPTFMERGHLRYQNNKSLIFEGGNEFHHFDAFSTYYAGTGIDRVYYEGGDYHVMLFPDEIGKGQYIHHHDADGLFMVNAERTQDSDTQAEYMWVHWLLPTDKPWLDGSVYVSGELFENEFSMRNRMQYDPEAEAYWLTALVKQGGYDFQYLFAGKGTQNKTTTQRVDGSYWQTGNEYTVYVYWRPFGARYDRLVGIQTIR